RPQPQPGAGARPLYTGGGRRRGRWRTAPHPRGGRRGRRPRGAKQGGQGRLPGQPPKRSLRAGSATRTAALVATAAPRRTAGPADGGAGQGQQHRRRDRGPNPGQAGRGAFRPTRPRRRALGATQAGAHLRGEYGEQSGVRAHGGGGGQGTRLLPGAAQGLRGGRGVLQLEVAGALLRGLHAPRGLLARVVLSVSGRRSGGGRRGGALGAIRPVAARVLARPGGGGDRAVAAMARADRAATAGGGGARGGAA